MRALLLVARHDLKLVLADRSAVAWMFVLPVVFMGFLGLVGGGGSEADPRVRLTVADADGGPVARALLEALESERLAIVAVPPEAKDETAGKVRTLVIPEGFSERVSRGEQTLVTLEKDPDASGEATLVAQARIVGAITRVLARLAGAEGAADRGSTALDSPTQAADLVRIEARFAGRARRVPQGFQQSIPGNLVMFVMLIALTYGSAQLTAERIGGQLRRLATSPLSRPQIVAGKIVGRLVVAITQVAVLAIAGAGVARLAGIPLGNDPVALLAVLLVYAATVAPLGVLLGAWFRDPDVAANVGVLITMATAALGGCWWPIEIVSQPLQRLALALPTGWAMRALHGVIAFGGSLADVAPSLLALGGFSFLFSIAAVRSLRID